MFGFLAGITFVGCCIAKALGTSSERERAKNENYISENRTYIYNCALYDYDTDYAVYHDTNRYGDRLLVNPHYNFVRNVSAEKRQKEYERLKRMRPKGITVAPDGVYDGWNLNIELFSKGICPGERFRDLDNNNRYVKKHFEIFKGGIAVDGKPKNSIGYGEFYMNIYTGKLERVVDGYWERRLDSLKIDQLHYPEKYKKRDIEKEIEDLKVIYDKWIEDFNEKQDEKMRMFEKEKEIVKKSESDIRYFYQKYFYGADYFVH